MQDSHAPVLHHPPVDSPTAQQGLPSAIPLLWVLAEVRAKELKK